MPAEHVPTKATRRKVSSYASVGIPQEDIARVIGIDPKTLRLHYRGELDTSSIIANAAVGGKAYEEAMNGNTAVLIWWTKARMGWRGETPFRDDQQAEPVTAITYVETDASQQE